MERKHTINYQAIIFKNKFKYEPYKIKGKKTIKLAIILIMVIFFSLNAFDTGGVDSSNTPKVNLTNILTFAGNSETDFQSPLVNKNGGL